MTPKRNQEFFVRRLFCPLLGVGLALAAQNALAYGWHQCNGDKSKWSGNSASYQIMQCSIPSGSARANDVTYSFQEWNNVHGMYDVFSWSFGATSCGNINHGNGTNEIFYGTNSGLDGALGVTWVRYSSSCNWSWDEQNIVEADIGINGEYNSFEWGNPPCNTYGVGNRTTVIHEMGHALGLNHYDDAMNLMMTNDGEGKYCGTHTVAPHGDDAAGGRFLYGSGNTSRDVGASEFYLEGPNDVELNTVAGTLNVCPGDRYTFRTSVGNLGTVSETYNIRWYLSTNKIISNSDIYAGAGAGGVVGANNFSTYPWTITIPYNVSYDTTYYLGTFIDWDGKIAERYEDNNTTYMARRIRIRSAGQC